ncbi:MAG: MMPL family transporter [Deltaproteobacteria bacterium]|nr:MMPL family transporter [Deltaproteobacteria bacterium]
MTAPRAGVRWWLLGLVVGALAGAAWLAQRRVRLETDITASIPSGDPVLAATRGILADHPALERIAVDVSFADGRADRDALAAAGDRLVERLRASELFHQVGMAEASGALAAFYVDVVRRLPALFTDEELARDVAPLLGPERVGAALQRRLDELAQLDGVGQAEAIAADPLGLRALVLGRLGALLPAGDAHTWRGHLLSGDDRHLLVLLNPRGRASDTNLARRLRALFADAERELGCEPDAGVEGRIVLTVVGGFRAALDNEETIRRDTTRAIWIASLGAALLILLCFPRPLLGLLALIPAGAGIVLALLAYSLLRGEISALALGFGGALVSITVDQGIAYLLFLDRTRVVRGAEAAHEIRSVGLFATLTTVAAFFALQFSGYPLLQQLGLFAGLAVGLTYLFIHLVFPLVFPAMPAARRGAALPVERWLTAATTNRGWAGPVIAGLLVVGFVAVGRPAFVVDLQAMNHVRPATLAAEARVKRVWGDVFNRVYAAVEAPTPEALQADADRLAGLFDGERARGSLAAAFVPSQVLPGAERSARNLAAWTRFWTPARVAELRTAIDGRGGELGFTADAFAPFFTALERPRVVPAAIPAGLFEMFGISAARDGRGWVWLGAVTPGPRYDAAAVFDRAAQAGFRLFDPRLFAQRLGAHLGRAFTTMVVIVGAAVLALVILLFLAVRTVVLAVLPLLFALAVTLGGLSLLGRPLDIPSLLLAVVVFGMGVDYSLYFVHTSQRLLDEGHPSFGPMRLTVFLASGSTLLGMLSLAFAEHPVLRSVGITGALGIAAAALGSFLILPPMLRRVFPGRAAIEWRQAPGEDPCRVVRRRYAGLSAHARLFTRFKLRLDPMFARLAELVGTPRTILDVGCGQGVPGAYLLARLPEARVTGVDPDAGRVRIAARVFGPRGEAICGGAPELPASPARIDVAICLDVIHQLSDEQFAATLRDVRGRLSEGGRFVLRATVPGAGRVPWMRRWEMLRLRRLGLAARYRTAAELRRSFEDAGLRVETVEPAEPGSEELWVVGVVPRAGAETC